jgi:magnesium chelatase accessory protein
MDWAKERATWPYSQHSRFVLCKPHRWHIQDIGDGPLILLIHGAGSSTHTWQHVIPLLIQTHRVIAIDLPGQGFTQLGAQQRCSLDAMAGDIINLCRNEGLQPDTIIGHSAGAAIALRISELAPEFSQRIIGINAALDTFKGVAGALFPFLAKAIAMMPFATDLFRMRASKGNAIERIIAGTGSNLSTHDLDFYKRLVASQTHVNATLHMMAQWQLEPLIARLPKNPISTLLIAGECDSAVPPSASKKAAARMLNARFASLPNLGHLAHEEKAGIVVTLIRDAFSDS